MRHLFVVVVLMSSGNLWAADSNIQPAVAAEAQREGKTQVNDDAIPDPYPREPQNVGVLIRIPETVAAGKGDASAAIQKAIDEAAQTGGTVEFPPGRYYVANKITLRANVTLLGALPRQTFLEDRDPKMPPKENTNPGDDQKPSLLVQANDLSTMFVVEPQEGNSMCRNIAVRGLHFVVEGGEPNKNQQFVCFWRCQDVYLGHCSFDSSSKSGEFGMFHQVDFTEVDGATCVHNRFHNGLAGTGMNGSCSARHLGTRGYFAMNLVTEYVDTGIGLWTGAQNCLVERNVLRGYSLGTKPYAVGVDCDGPNHCTIRYNSITGGQIGVRLHDCHSGDYPITAVIVEKNRIGGQRDNPNGNPAACIKAVHQIHDQVEQYNMEFAICDNHFEVENRGIMMYSYAKRGSPHWCIPTIHRNTFVKKPTSCKKVIIIGGFHSDGQFLIHLNRNDFWWRYAHKATKPMAAIEQFREANPVISINRPSESAK